MMPQRKATNLSDTKYCYKICGFLIYFAIFAMPVEVLS